MNMSEPNLSNAASGSPPPLHDRSSPLTAFTGERDDSRFVMPSISPFPSNNDKPDSAHSAVPTNPNNAIQQPTIPLPLLANPNPNPNAPQTHQIRQNHHSQSVSHPIPIQHNHSAHSSHSVHSNNPLNLSNIHSRINQNPQRNCNTQMTTNICPNRLQQQQQQQHSRSNIGNSFSHNQHRHGPHCNHQSQMHHSQQLRHHNGIAMNNNNMHTRAHMHRNNSAPNMVQRTQLRPHNSSNTSIPNTNGGNGANSQNASNINNVNHIQNKYNTTIINLNGVGVGGVGNPTNVSTPYYPQIHATAPISMQQSLISSNNSQNGTVGNDTLSNSDMHSYDQSINVPYPGPTHGCSGNVHVMRAKARNCAQHPMSPNMSTRGSIIGNKYKILSILADGTFSRTVCAQNINTLKLVAIKIMKAKCQYVGVEEAKRLRFFNSKDSEDLCHVVRFIESIHDQSRFCLVLEILGISLYKSLQIRDSFSLNLVRKIAIQLMISIQFVHSFNQIHADLKPENVLVCAPYNTVDTADRNSEELMEETVADMVKNEHCTVKVIDFGNSISLAEREAYMDKFEIQSLYYRAPEVLLGCTFGLSIDIWSIGCILMELVMGKPLFATHNKNSLCQQIYSVLGPFPIHAYQNAKFYKEYFTEPGFVTHQSIYSQLYTQRYEGIDKILKTRFSNEEWSTEHDYFVQFIVSLLDLDPNTRMKASDSFYHPFLQKLFPFKLVFGSKEHKSKQIKADPHSHAQAQAQQQRGGAIKKVSLSNIDLSDNTALQKHKQNICHNQHTYGAECTKLPPNFRNPLIQQLQQNNPHSSNASHTHEFRNNAQHNGHNNSNANIYSHSQSVHTHEMHRNNGNNVPNMNMSMQMSQSHGHGNPHRHVINRSTHGPHGHHITCQSHPSHPHTHMRMHHNQMSNGMAHRMNNPMSNGMHQQSMQQNAAHMHAHNQHMQQQRNRQSMAAQQQFLQMNNAQMRGNPFSQTHANGMNDSKIGLIDHKMNVNSRKRRVINDSQSVSTDFSQPSSKKTKR